MTDTYALVQEHHREIVGLLKLLAMMVFLNIVVTGVAVAQRWLDQGEQKA